MESARMPGWLGGSPRLMVWKASLDLSGEKEDIMPLSEQKGAEP
jgi:hypothetical protein